MKKVNCLMVLVLLVLFGDGQVTGPPNAATIKLSNGGMDQLITFRSIHCLFKHAQLKITQVHFILGKGFCGSY